MCHFLPKKLTSTFTKYLQRNGLLYISTMPSGSFMWPAYPQELHFITLAFLYGEAFCVEMQANDHFGFGFIIDFGVALP